MARNEAGYGAPQCRQTNHHQREQKILSCRNPISDLYTTVAGRIGGVFAALAANFAQLGQRNRRPASACQSPTLTTAIASNGDATLTEEHSTGVEAAGLADLSQSSRVAIDTPPALMFSEEVQAPSDGAACPATNAAPVDAIEATSFALPPDTVTPQAEPSLAKALKKKSVIKKARKTTPAPAVDLELESMRAGVAAMEIRVVDLEATKAEMEQLLDEYASCQYRALGELIGEQLRLQHEVLRQRAERSSSPDDDQAADAAAREYQSYRQALDEPNVPKAVLSDGEREKLKALYRTVVMRCHPDRVDEAAKLMAHEMFLRTQDAYRRGDLESMLLISRQLATGELSSSRNDGSSPRERQEALLESLLDKGTELLMAIQSIKIQATYRRAKHREHWEDDFAAARNELENECAALRRQLSAC